ncbi:dTMP kinase [bacterium]|jgi:dTMP kinase|nr:dTMP kinase [bacterium]
MSKGRLITFEGPEGAGKSTQLDILVSRLEKKGHKVVRTREPGGGGALSLRLRDLLLSPDTGKISIEAELFLILAARSEHMQNLILPGLRSGALVLCDRFIDSTVAYQGYGRGVALEMIKSLNRYVICGRYPDLTLIFDIPPDVGLERAGKNSDLDRIEQEKLEFHERVREGFQCLSTDSSRYHVVDSMLSVEEISEDIWARVKRMIPDED